MEPKNHSLPESGPGHRNEGHKVRHCHFAGHGLSDGGLFALPGPEDRRLRRPGPPPLLPELKGADLVITLGGDGTILHLAKLVALTRSPCWASTWGTGLSGGAGGRLSECLARPENWDFPIEERMMLDVSVQRDGKQIYTNLGLNDAVIREGPISHVIHLKVFLRRKAPCGYRRRRCHHCHPHRVHGLLTSAGGRWWSRGPDPDSDTHLHPQYALFFLCPLSGPHPDGQLGAQWPQADIPVCG